MLNDESESAATLIQKNSTLYESATFFFVPMQRFCLSNKTSEKLNWIPSSLASLSCWIMIKRCCAIFSSLPLLSGSQTMSTTLFFMFEQTQNVRGSEDHKRGFMLHTSNAHIASFQNKLHCVDDILLVSHTPQLPLLRCHRAKRRWTDTKRANLILNSLCSWFALFQSLFDVLIPLRWW